MTSIAQRRRVSEPRMTRPKRHRVPIIGPFTVNLVLLIGAAYMIMPVSWLIFAVTKNAQNLYTTPGFAFGDIALIENITMVLSDSNGVFVRWMGNSILYAGVGAVLGGLIAVMAGYAFDKLEFRGKKLSFTLVLVGVLIPKTATVLPLYFLAASAGLTNSMWAKI